MAVEAEEKLQQKLEFQVKIMENLNKEIKKHKDEQLSEEQENNRLELEFKDLKLKLHETEELNKNMIVSIQALEIEMETLMSELKTGKIEQFDLKNNLEEHRDKLKVLQQENQQLNKKLEEASLRECTIKNSFNESPEDTKHHNVIILGDSTVVNLHKYLKIQSMQNYNVMTLVKHNGTLENIVQVYTEFYKAGLCGDIGWFTKRLSWRTNRCQSH
ncbi:unnamed protein product [Ceutorhynchus assimilis]|uniref:Uncharacterized protein n=1 Tax=Ceutorhynchus assimilis TaxID=467358 RepID=A0A9N9QPP5_9CUCU|nr:unnamed protein product [Ceutorhynchus assimilis]